MQSGVVSRLVGRKYLELAKSWSKTGALFGTTGIVGTLYFTDWKLVLQYLPFYNTKFSEESQ
ncbi:cytochrome b-c1 complex subunit 10-like [Tachypleus tridentatus]|uniref:cytochrome b-c1 complex subunit 10-like n=1 Tax=Tachypleus tridentatus TaxID=6853 RepID=UPI003FD62665